MALGEYDPQHVMPTSWEHTHSASGKLWTHPIGEACDQGEPPTFQLMTAAESRGYPDKFAEDVHNVFEDAYNVLLKKHQDYGPKNISQSPGGPLNGLRVRMHDKLARINNLLDSGATPENESLRDSFLDLMNYAAIAQVVLDGNWPDK